MKVEINGEAIAYGVVVYVNFIEHYAYLHAKTYDRVLLVNYFNSEKVQLGNWLSLRIKLNDHPVLIPKITACRFTDDSAYNNVRPLLPVEVSSHECEARCIKMQTPLFVGNISTLGGTGLSPVLGRVFIPFSLLKKCEIESLHWISCGVRSAKRSISNFFCLWDAQILVRGLDDQKGEVSSLRREGCFREFVGANMLLISFLGEEPGCAFVRSTDFVHEVSQEELMSDNVIEVYALAGDSAVSNLPVQVCYARLLDSNYKPSKKKLNEEIGHGITATASRDSVYGNISKCQPDCRSTNLLRRILLSENVLEKIENTAPDVFNRIVAVATKSK